MSPYICDHCFREVPDDEAVGETIVTKLAPAPSGRRYQPYILRRGADIGASGMSFSVIVYCWKCWDAVGVTNPAMLVDVAK